MSGRLGCLDSFDAYISDSCGAPRICGLTSVAAVTWNRILDDISAAQVVIPLASGVSSTKPCCDCLDLIEPWCHELHLIRNGEEVWTGPITSITYGFASVTINALDVLGWLLVRVPQGVLDNTKLAIAQAIGTVGPKYHGNEITDLAVKVLQTAFDEADPCVLDYVVQTDLDSRPTLLNDTLISAANGFPAFEGTVHDWLVSLSSLGLDYTTLGRRILLGVHDVSILSIGTLTDDMILGEIQVTKDGRNMANRVFERFEKDTDAAQCTANNPDIPAPPCPSISESADINTICYGPIERVISDGVPFDYNTAKMAGDQVVESGKIAPRTIDFSSGTKLSQDTPWEINAMIPGQKVNVILENLCLPVNQSFRLIEVNYTLQVSGEEEVSVKLGPFNLVGQI